MSSAVLRAFDSEGVGSLSITDFRRYLVENDHVRQHAHVGETCEETVLRLFVHADKDYDDRLSAKEFEAVRRELSEAHSLSHLSRSPALLSAARALFRGALASAPSRARDFEADAFLASAQPQPQPQPQPHACAASPRARPELLSAYSFARWARRSGLTALPHLSAEALDLLFARRRSEAGCDEASSRASRDPSAPLRASAGGSLGGGIGFGAFCDVLGDASRECGVSLDVLVQALAAKQALQDRERALALAGGPDGGAGEGEGRAALKQAGDAGAASARSAAGAPRCRSAAASLKARTLSSLPRGEVSYRAAAGVSDARGALRDLRASTEGLAEAAKAERRRKEREEAAAKRREGRELLRKSLRDWRREGAESERGGGGAAEGRRDDPLHLGRGEGETADGRPNASSRVFAPVPLGFLLSRSESSLQERMRAALRRLDAAAGDGDDRSAGTSVVRRDAGRRPPPLEVPEDSEGSRSETRIQRGEGGEVDDHFSRRSTGGGVLAAAPCRGSLPPTPASVVPNGLAPHPAVSDSSSAGSSAISSPRSAARRAAHAEPPRPSSREARLRDRASTSRRAEPRADPASTSRRAGLHPGASSAPRAGSAQLPLRLRARLLDVFTAHAAYGARRDELRGLRLRSGQFRRLALAAAEGAGHEASSSSAAAPPLPAAVDLAFSRAAPDALARGVTFGAFLTALEALADETGRELAEVAALVADAPSPEAIAKAKERERERERAVLSPTARACEGSTHDAGKENVRGRGCAGSGARARGSFACGNVCALASPVSPSPRGTSERKAWNAGLAPLEYPHLSSPSSAADASRARSGAEAGSRARSSPEAGSRAGSGAEAGPRARAPLSPLSPRAELSSLSLHHDVSDRPLAPPRSEPSWAAPGATAPQPSWRLQAEEDCVFGVSYAVAATPDDAPPSRVCGLRRPIPSVATPRPPRVLEDLDRVLPIRDRSDTLTWLQTTSLEADELGTYVEHALAPSPGAGPRRERPEARRQREAYGRPEAWPEAQERPEAWERREAGSPESAGAESYASCPSPIAPSVSVWLPHRRVGDGKGAGRAVGT